VIDFKTLKEDWNEYEAIQFRYPYLLDKIERLEREIRLLKEEIARFKKIFIPVYEIELSIGEADVLKKKVLEYIKEHPGVLTSEILERFEDYPPPIILKILYELKREGKVKSRSV